MGQSVESRRRVLLRLPKAEVVEHLLIVERAYNRSWRERAKLEREIAKRQLPAK